MQLHEEVTPVTNAGVQETPSVPMAMGSLLADMNHDIRTSVNSVRGMLALLLDTGLTPSQQEYARSAQHSVDTLMESLERIVDMSLIESNRFQLNQSPFDLLLEMQAACTGKEACARARGISLAIHYPPALRLYGDAARLREAASVLIDVALQCAAGEHLSAAMSTTYLTGGRFRVDIAVRAAQLSEDGVRLASLMNQTIAEGVGAIGGSKEMLGIGLCARLVQLMDGILAVDRTEAPGATFRISIELPLAEDALDTVRALVLSDQAENWKAALAPLECHGLHLDAYDSAIKGLDAVESAAVQAPYQIILLGHQVEGMDPGVFASAIRGNRAYRNALLVLLDVSSGNVPRPGDGFSAYVGSASDPVSIESIMADLCIAVTNGAGESSPTMPEAGRKEELRPATFAGCTVLVADDNPVNQQVAARMLEKLGCNAAVAADGMQAVEMHTWKRFDLILMDCDMPVLDGLEATQRIRQAEGTERRTPIIALTACTGQGEQELCIAAGMDDFLSKPIRPQMLCDVLARWLPVPGPVAGAQLAPACEDELEEVKEMFGADFAELAALYQHDGPPRLAALREASAAGDIEKVAKVAHAFSGSSASIGATGLSSTCRKVEAAAKAGSLEDLDQQIATIENEYRRVCGKLKSLLTS